MSYYNILIGAQNMRDREIIEEFGNLADARATAKALNDKFIAEYATDDDWRNDPNSLEWVTFSKDEAAKDYPNLLMAI